MASQQGDVHHYPAAMVMNNQQYQWGPYNNDQNQMLTGYYQYFLSNTLNQQATLYAQQSQQSTFYTTTADTIASSPLWEQLRLPTTFVFICYIVVWLKSNFDIDNCFFY